MEDSLEDYLRISKNVKGEEHPSIPKEALTAAFLQKQCSTKAMQIVKFTIEGKIRPDALFKCLPFIDQDHYQDIVEERAIAKICGYPLCGRKLPEMPMKQYFISTKNNRVYDITERKNFCTNHCYSASLHIKNQIDTSPLWLRKHDEPSQFTLFNQSNKGIPGKVVDQGVSKTKPTDLVFTSISNFAEMSLEEAEENEVSVQEEKEDKLAKNRLRKSKKYTSHTSMNTINENDEEIVNESVEDPKIIPSCPNVEFELPKPEVNDDEVPREVPKTPNNPGIIKRKKNHKPKMTKELIEAQIRKYLSEWMSLDSLIFLHGEETVKQKLGPDQMAYYFETLKVSQLNLEQRRKYFEICKKLQLRELAEEKYQSNLTGQDKLNPIPDYNQLKEESKELDLKVKSFYSGLLLPQDNTTAGGTRSNINKDGHPADDTEEGPPAVLPQTETHSQKALRKKIFLNSISKTMQGLLQSLRVEPNLVLPDLQALVTTFNFKPDNIIFKSTVANYVAVVLLKILSCKSTRIEEIFQTERAQTTLDLCNKETFLDDVLSSVKDIDIFMNNFINN